MLFVSQGAKRDLLVDMLNRPEVETSLVFTRTKYGADKVVRYLKNGIRGEAIHGSKSSRSATAMNAFRSGKIKVLVATDIAARGIDVKGVSHVINFEIPNISETYVHRITNRTGRRWRRVLDGQRRRRTEAHAQHRQADSRDIPWKRGTNGIWTLPSPWPTQVDGATGVGGGQPQQLARLQLRNRNRNRNGTETKTATDHRKAVADRPSLAWRRISQKKKPKFKGPRAAQLTSQPRPCFSMPRVAYEAQWRSSACAPRVDPCDLLAEWLWDAWSSNTPTWTMATGMLTKRTAPSPSRTGPLRGRRVSIDLQEGLEQFTIAASLGIRPPHPGCPRPCP